MQSRFLFLLLGLLLSGSAWAQGPRKPPPRKRRPAVVVEAVQIDLEPYVFSRQDSLLLAAATNDLALARHLLARGAEANRPYADTLNQRQRYYGLPENKLTLPDWTQVREGETPLLLAVRRGHLELTDLLLRHCPDQGQEAAKWALCEALAYVPNQEAMLERLLATGLPPDSLRCELSPLSTIISYNAGMRQRLAQGPSRRPETAAQRNRRRYRMGSAVRYEQPLHPLRPDSVNLRLLRLLLAAGAQPTPGDLYHAVRCHETELARYLLTHGVRVRAPAADMAPVLNMAAGQPDGALLRLLLDQGADPNVADDQGVTPLHRAAALADTALLRLLLRQGANPNARNNRDETPLHLVAGQASPRPTALLLAAGAAASGRPAVPGCPDCGDGQGNTPLHRAAHVGRPATVRLLLAAGAPFNACDAEQQTPLQLAVSPFPYGYASAVIDDWGWGAPASPATAPSAVSAADKEAVLRLLLAAGASPQVGDNFWNTPLHVVASDYDTLRTGLLLRAGANPNQTDRNGNPPLAYVRSVAVLRQLRAAGGRFGGAASTILLNPTAAGRPVPLAITAAALEDGGRLDEISSDGDTPLHLAAADPESDLGTVAFYLSHGARLEARNRSGWTPLTTAVVAQRPALVQLLLDAGARPDADPSPLTAAARLGSEALVGLLLRYGAPVNRADSLTNDTPLLGAVASTVCLPGVLARLLRAGANPNVADSLGHSPLYLLALHHGQQVLGLLTTAQSSDWQQAPGTLAPQEVQALQRAQQQRLARADAWLLADARLLLRHGARPDSRNHAGQPVAEVLRFSDTAGSRQLLAELEQAEKQGAAGGK